MPVSAYLSGTGRSCPSSPGSVPATKISPTVPLPASSTSSRSSSRSPPSSAIPPSTQWTFPRHFNARRTSTGPVSPCSSFLVGGSLRPPVVQRQRSCSITCVAWRMRGPAIQTLRPRTVRRTAASSMRIPAVRSVNLDADRAAPTPLTLRVPRIAPTSSLESPVPPYANPTNRAAMPDFASNPSCACKPEAQSEKCPLAGCLAGESAVNCLARCGQGLARDPCAVERVLSPTALVGRIVDQRVKPSEARCGYRATTTARSGLLG